MLNNAWDWEIASFFLLVLAFGAWERFRPARAVDHLADLKLDLLSFTLAVLMNRVSRRAVDAVVNSVSPGFVLDSLHYIRAWPSWVKIAAAMAVMYAIKAVGLLRVSAEGESYGLDLHEHGISAYPEYVISSTARPGGMAGGAVPTTAVPGALTTEPLARVIAGEPAS